MAGHYCKHCAHFECEMMTGDGEPLMYQGYCRLYHKCTDADDYCTQFDISKWAKRMEAARDEH